MVWVIPVRTVTSQPRVAGSPWGSPPDARAPKAGKLGNLCDQGATGSFGRSLKSAGGSLGLRPPDEPPDEPPPCPAWRLAISSMRFWITGSVAMSGVVAAAEPR